MLVRVIATPNSELESGFYEGQNIVEAASFSSDGLILQLRDKDKNVLNEFRLCNNGDTIYLLSSDPPHRSVYAYHWPPPAHFKPRTTRRERS